MPDLTAAGFILSCIGWSGLWGEALLRAQLVPLPLLAALFFAGLGLGAVGERCKLRRRETLRPAKGGHGDEGSFVLGRKHLSPHLLAQGLGRRREAPCRHSGSALGRARP